MALPLVRLCNIERVEKHRPLAIRVDEFVTVRPADESAFVLGDQYERLGPGEELSCVDVTLQAKEPTRVLDKLRITAAGSTQPLLVTHEMIGRMLLRALLGFTPEEALGLSLPHGVVIEVRPPEGRLTTIEPAPS